MSRTFEDYYEIINVKDYGAKGDGATDDAAAIQSAINAAYGSSAAPHGGLSSNAVLNKPVYFPPGEYIVHSPISLYMVSGAKIYGAGRQTTLIHNNTSVASSSGSVFLANGLAYSKIEDMTIRCEISTGTNACCFDADWDGTTTFSVQLQQNTFQNVLFTGGGYGLRLANSNHQGDTHLLLNCAISNCRVAGIYVSAQNCIQNQMVGGNVSQCGNGIWGGGGFFDNYYDVNFQQNGWPWNSQFYGSTDTVACDIRFDSNQGNGIFISGCRTESDNFVRNLAGASIVVSGCAQQSYNYGDFFETLGGTCEVFGCTSYTGRIKPKFWANLDIRNSLFYRSDWLFVDTPGNLWYIANNQSPCRINAKNVLNVVSGTEEQSVYVSDGGTVIRRNRNLEGTDLNSQTVIYAAGSPSATTLTQISTAATVFNCPKHSLYPDTPIAFKAVNSSGVPAGINTGQVYYAISVPVTPTTSDNLLTTVASHGLVAGDHIKFVTTGTFPGGIDEWIDYAVLSSSTATTFKIYKIMTGGAVTLTSTGTGTLGYYGSGFDGNKFQASSAVGGPSITSSGSLTTTLYTVGAKTFYVGDTVTRSNVVASSSPGWVCTTTGQSSALTGGTAVFRTLQNCS